MTRVQRAVRMPAGDGTAVPGAGGPADAVPDTESVVDAVLASSRALVAISARSLAGAGSVTLPQYRMLVVLSAGPTKLASLAHALDVAPSTATRMVDRLAASGLVDRSSGAPDRRQVQLALTAAGRRTVRTVTDRRRRDLRAVVLRVPVDQRSALTAALTAFAAAAEDAWA